MNRNIFLLWQGQLISQLGMQAYTIAMMFWLMENAKSSILMSTMMILSILPSSLLGPLAGVFADIYSKKKIIILTDFLRGLSVFALFILIFWEFNNNLIILAFGFVSIILGISRAFFQPTVDSLIPELVSQEKLSKTVAAFQSSAQFSNIIGQLLGGILYRLFGAPLLFLFDSISYIFSAISQAFIKTTDKEKRISKDIKSTFSEYKENLVIGLKYVKSNKGMFPSMLFASSVNLFLAPIMLFLPFHVTEQIQEKANWYGFLLAAMALGSILGYWVSASISLKSLGRTFKMFVGMLSIAIGIYLLSQSKISFHSLFSICIVGLGLGLFNLQSITLFQEGTPDELRGRVMSLLMAVSSALLPLGLLLSGFLGTLINNDTALIFMFSSVSILVITILSFLNLNIREFIGNEINRKSEICN
ncbi:MFS transporter [Thalassotalea aquiviva]|uniref:MFS transporter n=1 Tax=Thalassotalea aquiviva TaxID=3242415 RepID=UPI00352AFF78